MPVARCAKGSPKGREEGWEDVVGKGRKGLTGPTDRVRPHRTQQQGEQEVWKAQYVPERNLVVGIREQAVEDCRKATQPDVSKPFVDLEDACERLLPFHVSHDEDEDVRDLDPKGRVRTRRLTILSGPPNRCSCRKNRRKRTTTRRRDTPTRTWLCRDARLGKILALGK